MQAGLMAPIDEPRRPMRGLMSRPAEGTRGLLSRWKMVRAARRLLRRHSVIVECDRCTEQRSLQHRPCYAVYCGCPCSR